jgi:cytochrome P450
MRNIVQTAVDELIDGLIDQGSMDLVSEFTYPLPARVMGNLLGVPAQDHDTVRDWTHAIALTVDPDG